MSNLGADGLLKGSHPLILPGGKGDSVKKTGLSRSHLGVLERVGERGVQIRLCESRKLDHEGR